MCAHLCACVFGVCACVCVCIRVEVRGQTLSALPQEHHLLGLRQSLVLAKARLADREAPVILMSPHYRDDKYDPSC